MLDKICFLQLLTFIVVTFILFILILNTKSLFISSITPVNNEEADFEVAQKMRRSRIAEVCVNETNALKLEELRRIYAQSRPPQIVGFKVIRKYRLLGCHAAKVGTTTLFYLYLQMFRGGAQSRNFKGTVHKKVQNVEKRSISDRDKYDLLKSLKSNRSMGYLTFMSFRHPIERLYSAYRGKIVSGKRRISGVTTFAEFTTRIGRPSPRVAIHANSAFNTFSKWKLSQGTFCIFWSFLA